jgi:osmoprotectant transport system substrate-binding protein
MRISRRLAIGAAAFALVLSACGSGGGSKPTVKIGSDGFYEAKLMAEIYGQALEAKGYTVDRTGIGVGARKVSAPALESGQFDLKPEYIGSGLAFYEPPAASPRRARGDAADRSGRPGGRGGQLQSVLSGKGGGITVLSYSPAADQNAFVTTKAFADAKSLKTMSDLGKLAGQFKLGVATDCPTNPVCGKALKDAYGIDIAPRPCWPRATRRWSRRSRPGRSMSASCARRSPTSSSTAGSSSEDDKHTQPADNIAPLVRNDLLTKLGSDKDAFEKILNDVSAAMDTATLTDLGKQVSVDNKDLAPWPRPGCSRGPRLLS